MFRNLNHRMANTISRVVHRQRLTAVRRRSSQPFLETLKNLLAPALYVRPGAGGNAFRRNGLPGVRHVIVPFNGGLHP